MIGSASSLASAIVSAAMSLGALGGTPAAPAAPAPAPAATQTNSEKPYMATTEYAMADTFSCDFYDLPWCR